MGVKYAASSYDYDYDNSNAIIRKVDEANRIVQDYTEIKVQVAAFDAAATVGDDKIHVPIGDGLGGMDLVQVKTRCKTKGDGSSVVATTVQVTRDRAGTKVDMLSAGVTHGDEYACEDGTVNTSNDDVADGDLLGIDIDTWRTGMLGFWVILCFRPRAS